MILWPTVGLQKDNALSQASQAGTRCCKERVFAHVNALGLHVGALGRDVHADRRDADGARRHHGADGEVADDAGRVEEAGRRNGEAGLVGLRVVGRKVVEAEAVRQPRGNRVADGLRAGARAGRLLHYMPVINNYMQVTASCFCGCMVH